ncbi:hypothetical protein BCR42DRAFT_417101 [Absidia repens]|uniref:Cyclin N-terminal domain-containing protein n=1 Tax=Absidia repens TaxID=90262 RepID=A0A1X2IDD5_9FUNG|nr:hypothetical protein BCR42DRAFT_417101 [Absidia repens]
MMSTPPAFLPGINTRYLYPITHYCATSFNDIPLVPNLSQQKLLELIPFYPPHGSTTMLDFDRILVDMMVNTIDTQWPKPPIPYSHQSLYTDIKYMSKSQQPKFLHRTVQPGQALVDQFLTMDTAPADTHAFVKRIIENSYSSYAIIMITISYLFRLKPCLDKAFLTSSFADRRYLSCGRRMFYAALILATKYHSDEAPGNRHWSIVSGLPVNQISQTEELFLKLMDYRLHITKEAYEQWAILIQRHCGRHPSHCSKPCHPSAAYTFQYPSLPTPIVESAMNMVTTHDHGDEGHEQLQQLLTRKQDLQQLPNETHGLQQQTRYLGKQHHQQNHQPRIHRQNQYRPHSQQQFHPRLSSLRALPQQFHQYHLPPQHSHLHPQQRPLLLQQPLQQINRRSQHHFQESSSNERSHRQQQFGHQQSSSPASSSRSTIRRRKPRRYITIRSTNRRSKSAKTIQIKAFKSLNSMKWMWRSIKQFTRVLLPPFIPIRLTEKFIFIYPYCIKSCKSHY